MESLINYEEVCEALEAWTGEPSQLDDIFEKCSGSSVQLCIFKDLSLKDQRYIWKKCGERTKGSLWFLMEPEFRWYMLLEVVCDFKTADIIWETRKTVKQPLCDLYDLPEVLSMLYV
jgi:hypothetical protein